MDRINKIQKSSSAAELTPATRNSFAEYALAKSAAALQPSPHQSSDRVDPDFVLPPPPPIITVPATNPKPPCCFTSDFRRLDLAAARREYDKCRTEAEKAEAKRCLKRAVLRHLKELTEMETGSKVGIEIAEAVDFLKALYSSDEWGVREMMEISEKSREGVVRLQEGQMLVKKSQDQLRAALRCNLFSVVDY